MSAVNFKGAAIAVAALVAAGCGSTGPTPIGPAIACPAPQTAQSPDGGAVPVHYPLPVVSGGAQPISLACTPPSGSTFNVGSAAVICTARDAKQQTASCSFGVTVAKPAKISATKFVAFGDSITAGTLDPPCTSASAFALGPQIGERQILAASINVSTSYPTLLQTLLVAQYPAQSPSVLNEGVGGEHVPEGVARLPGVLTTDAPQVLLLEEGINDIDNSNPVGSTAFVIKGLRTMIQHARSAGVQTFLANLLPERLGTCRGHRAPYIASANDQIRALAASENVVLVDLYAAFGPDAPTTLIGFDGLHPTAAGYELIAQTFFESIRQKLEVASVPLKLKTR